MIMLTRTHIAAFTDELEKTAMPPVRQMLAGAVKSLAARGSRGGQGMGGILGWVHPALNHHFGRQMLLGAGVGGAIGAGSADDGNRLGGLARGALAGATTVGAGHLFTHAGREAAKGSVQNLGSRLRYQFTGTGKIHPNDITGAQKAGLLPKELSEADTLAHMKGWNTIPGVAKGLVKHPGQVVSNAWNRMDTTGKVLTGLAAADTGYQAFRPSEPGEAGRAERAIGSGLGTLGALVAPTGMLPSIAVSMAAGSLGSRAGRLIDRVAGYNPSAVDVPQMQGG